MIIFIILAIIIVIGVIINTRKVTIEVTWSNGEVEHCQIQYVYLKPLREGETVQLEDGRSISRNTIRSWR